MTGGAGQKEPDMTRRMNFTAEGERVLSVTLDETVAATMTRKINGLSGAYEVAYGDEHEVRVDGDVLGTVQHGVRDIEANSTLFEAETWSVVLPGQMYPLISNILSEEEAVRILISVKESR